MPTLPPGTGASGTAGTAAAPPSLQGQTVTSGELIREHAGHFQPSRIREAFPDRPLVPVADRGEQRSGDQADVVVPAGHGAAPAEHRRAVQEVRGGVECLPEPVGHAGRYSTRPGAIGSVTLMLPRKTPLM